jgi:hypothetical protein
LEKPKARKTPKKILADRLEKKGLSQEEIQRVIQKADKKRIEARLKLMEKLGLELKGHSSFLYYKMPEEVFAEKIGHVAGIAKKGKRKFLKELELDPKVFGQKKLKPEQVNDLSKQNVHALAWNVLPWMKDTLREEHALDWLHKNYGWPKESIRRYARKARKKLAGLKSAGEGFNKAGLTPTMRQLVEVKGTPEKRRETIKEFGRKKKKKSDRQKRIAALERRFKAAGVVPPDYIASRLGHPSLTARLKYLQSRKIGLKTINKKDLWRWLIIKENEVKVLADRLVEKGTLHTHQIIPQTRQAAMKALASSDEPLRAIGQRLNLPATTLSNIKKTEGIWRPAEKKAIEKKVAFIKRNGFSEEAKQSDALKYLTRVIKLPEKDLRFLFAAFPLNDLDRLVRIMRSSQLVEVVGSPQKAFEKFRRLMRLTPNQIRDKYLPQLIKKIKASKRSG